jgi:hypothetical protein
MPTCHPRKMLGIGGVKNAYAVSRLGIFPDLAGTKSAVSEQLVVESYVRVESPEGFASLAALWMSGDDLVAEQVSLERVFHGHSLSPWSVSIFRFLKPNIIVCNTSCQQFSLPETKCQRSYMAGRGVLSLALSSETVHKAYSIKRGSGCRIFSSKLATDSAFLLIWAFLGREIRLALFIEMWHNEVAMTD